MNWRLSFTASGPSPRDRRAWQNTIAMYCQQAMLESEADLQASPGPVAVSAEFTLGPPKGLGAAKRRYHLKEPDPWTLSTAVRDGLKGIAYINSAIVTDLVISKRYADRPGDSRVSIEIWEVA